MLHALDSQILLRFLTAIGERMTVNRTNASQKSENQAAHFLPFVKHYFENSYKKRGSTFL